MSAPAPSSPVVVDAEPLPRQEEVLTDEALAFVAELHRRFTPRRAGLLARRCRAPRGDRPDLHARLPPGDRRDPRGRVLEGGPSPARAERPAGRDHRPHRPQDDDQRPQLGREDLARGLRGRLGADVGERRHGPAQPDRRLHPRHRLHRPQLR
ncbi:hypothetical protein ACRAWF_19345 [Streptomyces sp. L7]